MSDDAISMSQSAAAVLCAAEGERLLAGAGGALVHELGDTRRADEGERADALVVAQRVDDLLRALHHLEDA